MGKICGICTDSRRQEIDMQLVKGNGVAKTARDYGVDYQSLWNHYQKHLTKSLVRAAEKSELIIDNNLLGVINKIMERTEKIFERNFAKGADLTSLKALDSQRNTLQLLSNISAALHSARMAEYELAKKDSGVTAQQAKEEHAIKLLILSTEELFVHRRMVNKINNQNTDVIILNGKVLTYKF
jgi:hypothetical protein